jgi:hypothetical protein
MTDLSWSDFMLISLLFIIGLAIFGVWSMLLRKRPFPKGILVYQTEGTIPVFHLTAEFAMAAITIVGAAGWLVGASWGPMVVIFGLGLFAYSCVNSMGWALHNSKSLAVPMIATFIIAMVVVPYLIVNS